MGHRIVLSVIIACMIAGLGLIGCGSVSSTLAIGSAEVAIESARMEQADRYAVYEFVSAELYIQKAREEWGQSDWQHSDKYADRALEMANAARRRAIASPARGAPQ